jgi:ABC-type bacteriocin/lantibiotic exporter with double-glycine peptidase domain
MVSSHFHLSKTVGGMHLFQRADYRFFTHEFSRRAPNLFRSDGGPEFVAHHSDQIARDYLDASAAHFRILMGQSIGALSLHAVASTALLGLGGWMVIDRQLTLGQLVAAELVVSAMIYGLTRLGKTLENFYEMMAGLDKLGHLLDLPAE